MMKCPFCSYNESKVIDSRPADEGTSIRRRRECLSCGKRFTSYEKVEEMPIMVIKKDGSRQSFNRNKVINGLLRACEKRPVSMDTIDNIVYELETSIYNSLEREITSVEIGEKVLQKLKKIDDVAFIRFASVYRDFKDIKTFSDEIKKLMNSN